MARDPGVEMKQLAEAIRGVESEIDHWSVEIKKLRTQRDTFVSKSSQRERDLVSAKTPQEQAAIRNDIGQLQTQIAGIDALIRKHMQAIKDLEKTAHQYKAGITRLRAVVLDPEAARVIASRPDLIRHKNTLDEISARLFEVEDALMAAITRRSQLADTINVLDARIATQSALVAAANPRDRPGLEELLKEMRHSFGVFDAESNALQQRIQRLIAQRDDLVHLRNDETNEVFRIQNIMAGAAPVFQKPIVADTKPAGKRSIDILNVADRDTRKEENYAYKPHTDENVMDIGDCTVFAAGRGEVDDEGYTKWTKEVLNAQIGIRTTKNVLISMGLLDPSPIQRCAGCRLDAAAASSFLLKRVSPFVSLIYVRKPLSINVRPGPAPDTKICMGSTANVPLPTGLEDAIREVLLHGDAGINSRFFMAVPLRQVQLMGGDPVDGMTLLLSVNVQGIFDKQTSTIDPLNVLLTPITAETRASTFAYSVYVLSVLDPHRELVSNIVDHVPGLIRDLFRTAGVVSNAVTIAPVDINLLHATRASIADIAYKIYRGTGAAPKPQGTVDPHYETFWTFMIPVLSMVMRTHVPDIVTNLLQEIPRSPANTDVAIERRERMRIPMRDMYVAAHFEILAKRYLLNSIMANTWSRFTKNVFGMFLFRGWVTADEEKARALADVDRMYANGTDEQRARWATAGLSPEDLQKIALAAEPIGLVEATRRASRNMQRIGIPRDHSYSFVADCCGKHGKVVTVDGKDPSVDPEDVASYVI